MNFRFSTFGFGLALAAPGRGFRRLAGFLTVFSLVAQTAFCQPPAAARDAQRIVVLGDSLAEGYGVGPSKAFPALLQARIDDLHLNATVINAGVGGDTSADGLRRLKWLLRQRMDVLVIELGANDGLRGLPVESTRANLQAIIDAVRGRYPAARIVIAGMLLPPNFGQAYTEAFRKIFPELATKNDAALIPFLLEGVGGVPELNQDDRIHPNEAGHRIVAENVWKVLQPLLEGRKTASGR